MSSLQSREDGCSVHNRVQMEQGALPRTSSTGQWRGYFALVIYVSCCICLPPSFLAYKISRIKKDRLPAHKILSEVSRRNRDLFWCGLILFYFVLILSCFVPSGFLALVFILSLSLSCFCPPFALLLLASFYSNNNSNTNSNNVTILRYHDHDYYPYYYIDLQYSRSYHCPSRPTFY